MKHFILYSRSYCHLCDDMLEQLQRFRSDHEFTVEVQDVDADEALVALYDELVPVLMLKTNADSENEISSKAKNPAEAVVMREICHYFLDQQKLLEVFNEA